MPNWSDVDTPAVLIDLEKVSANLLRVQGYADANGLTLRPHIKTHGSSLRKFAGRIRGLWNHLSKSGRS